MKLLITKKIEIQNSVVTCLERSYKENSKNLSNVIFPKSQYVCALGLNWTGHMSFLTGQDRTPKFAGQVLPDRTKSGLIFLNILHTKYGDFGDCY